MITIEIPNFFRGATLKEELKSMQWGLATRGGNMGAGEAGVGKFLPASEINVVRPVDQYAAEFISRAVQGPEFPKVTLRLHKRDGRNAMVPYLEIVLSKVMVSFYHIGQGNPPLMNISLAFAGGKFQPL